MRNLLLIASAAAMSFSMPAVAEGPGKGKGASAKAQKSMSVKRNGKSQVRTDVRARTDARAIVRARTRTGASVDRLDTNRDGIVDRRDRRIDRNRDGVDDRMQNQYGGNICPPGLAKKTPACIPPGQAKRMFNEGQRIPVGYDFFTDYNDIPEAFRTRVPYSDANRYIYREDRVYVVDPTTRLVTSIIDLLL